MNQSFARTEMLLGEGSIDKLKTKKVIVFGIGGVGGHAAEALARCGIGSISLVDPDVVNRSNINRQAVATIKTIGRKKIEVMKERILDINPDCEVEVFDSFYLPEKAEEFHLVQYDYIIDAIDTITGKIDLAVIADQMDIGIISAMGAGNKLDPTQFEVTDI
ncbi:MAG TPA: ThiF family adenylyltransferase, partial [Lachnospiraceae bacterium]|nr:ThiF family adenylyltransferase [Lachnospiraceae bacterium]